MTTYVEARHLTVTGDNLTRRMRARTARALAAAIFYALLALMALAAVPYGTVEEWWESLFQCAVFALAALWAVEGLLSGRWLVRGHLLLAPLAPLVGFVFLQSVPFGRDVVAGVEVWRTLSADPYETWLAAFRFLALILFAAMLLRYTSSRRRLGALVCAAAGVGVLSALFGLARYAMQDGEGFVLPHLTPRMGFGQFVNANHFALMAEMCLGLLLGLAAARGARRRGLQLSLCVAAAALLWTALVLSTSRGGIFAMMGQLVFLVLLRDAAARHGRNDEDAATRRDDEDAEPWRDDEDGAARQNDGGGAARRDDEDGAARRDGGDGGARPLRAPSLVARAAAAACLLLVVGVGVVWVGGERLTRRMERLRIEIGARGTGSRDYPSRIEMWRATWLMFKDHPLAGAGFGGYWLAVDRYYDASGVGVPQQAHNDYLELLASGGLVAAAAAALFVVGFIRRARESLRARDPFRRAACFGALAGLFGVALHSFVDFGLHVTANALVFTALVVVAAARVGTDERVRAGDAGRADDRRARPTFKDGLSRIGRRLASRFRRRRALWIGRRGSGIGRRAARGAVVVGCVLGCSAAMWTTARAGLSRWYSTSRARVYSLASAERAVRLSPRDPAARFFRAVLLPGGEYGEASEELRQTVALRPRSHLMWLNLGFAHESGGDVPGALAAFHEAARLAPFYAQPRWILGAALLRAGECERALAEVQRALASAPEPPPEALELDWGATGACASARASSPQSASARVALARFFNERGRTKEAAALLRQAGDAADAERRAMVAELISAKKFREAYELWSGGRDSRAGARRGGPESVPGDGFGGHIIDGGFEDDVSSESGISSESGNSESVSSFESGSSESGSSFEGGVDRRGAEFGWRAAAGLRGLSASADAREARAGARSLRLDFDGDVSPRSSLVSQLVLAGPESRYRLSFAARARWGETEGPPALALTDAGSGRELAPQTTFPSGPGGWRDYSVEFTTGRDTGAVVIAVRRRPCAAARCPIKGSLWLDDFSLRKLATKTPALPPPAAKLSF